MAEHLVDHDLQPTPMRLDDETVEVREFAEERVDGAEVGNVVAEIGHG